jgi:hypothetical protein
METPRRMQSDSRGGSSPLPPPFPTPSRQLAHWPVQTPPGASRVSPFRPSPWRHRDAPPRRTPRSLPGRASRRQGDERRLQLACLVLSSPFKDWLPFRHFCPGLGPPDSQNSAGNQSPNALPLIHNRNLGPVRGRDKRVAGAALCSWKPRPVPSHT